MLNVQKSDPATYAVTLEQAKTWLALDHNGYDDMLTDIIIPGAQDLIERATGICLTEADITAEWDSPITRLPFEPWISGDVLADTTTGSIAYKAGYTTGAPKGLITAMLNLITHLFQNRGDNTIPKQIAIQLYPYTRNL